MSEHDKGPRRIELPADPGDDSIARLLKAAGGRPPIPEVDAQIVRAAARAEWQSTVRVERWKRRGTYGGGLLAAAAVLLLVVDPAAWRSWLTDAPPRVATVPLAGVEAVQGEARVERASGEVDVLTTGGQLFAGDVVATTAGAARAVFRLADGAAVHLDRKTRVRMGSSSRLALEGGAVYVDSDTAGPALTIATPFGDVTDVGTRFEVRLASDPAAPDPAVAAMWVRVREGVVELDRDGDRRRAGAGVELAVPAEGTVVPRELSRCDTVWDWTLEILPRLELATAADLVEWATADGCWQANYADDRSRSLAHATLGGTPVTGLSLAEAAQTVTLGGGGLVIELDPENRRLLISSEETTR